MPEFTVPSGWKRGERLSVRLFDGYGRTGTYYQVLQSLDCLEPSLDSMPAEAVFCVDFYSLEKLNDWLQWWHDGQSKIIRRLTVKVYKSDGCVSVNVQYPSGLFSAGTGSMNIVDGVWRISRVYVSPGYRNNGIGKLILNRLKQEADGRGIEVYPGGQGTPKKVLYSFYGSCGFEGFSHGDYFVWTGD